MDTRDQDHERDYLACLAGDEWAVWRWVGLRSAGLPVERLQSLANLTYAEATDAYLELERQMQLSRQKLIGQLRQGAQALEPEQRRRLRQGIQQLEQGSPPDTIVEAISGQDFASYQHVYATAATAFARLEDLFIQAQLQTMRALDQIARDPIFREALTWQNRLALKTGVDVLLSRPIDREKRSSKRRQKEALVTSYIQRYCAKNDTIGFFGPVAWAYVADQGPLVQVKPGSALLARRTVYFEQWGLDRLAETLSRNEALRPWFVPRRLPFVHVEGMLLHLPLTRPVRLSPAQAAVLQACDGVLTARELAEKLSQGNVPSLSNEADVFNVLAELQARRRIAWALEVAGEELYPEKNLRQQLVRIEDEASRTEVLATLAALERDRDAVALAAGKPDQLEQALAALENTFTRLTGAEATRHSGQVYAGRTLVYEDCLRDIQVELGAEFASTLGPALSPLLASARWFVSEAFTLYREAFQSIYDELASSTGNPAIQLSGFWLYIHSLLFDAHLPLLDTLTNRLQERWHSILHVPVNQRQVVYRVEDLRQRAEELFSVSNPEWRLAYYHSPDVMMAAKSLDDILHGRFQWVLGEIHAGVNTLQSKFFVAQHPSPHELLRAIARDRPGPRIMLVPSKELEGATSRMSNAYVLPSDWRFVFSPDSCHIPVDRAIPIAELLVEQCDGQLQVYTRDRKLQWDIMDLLGEFILLQVLHCFHPFQITQHMPRIYFDRLIVNREAWHFQPKDLTFARIEREDERFIAVQRWKQAHGLPRRTFIKVPGERKPFYLDLASLASIDVFSRTLRRAQDNSQERDSLLVTEMVPDPDEAWLTDHQGQHYTCEFRFIVVDRRLQNEKSAQ